MKIIFAGGGTGGPVTPLLAVFEELKSRDSNVQALWIGTKKGPEIKLLVGTGIAFRPIFSGKLRRYFSWRNIFDPILIFLGLIQSFFIILKFKPDVIMSAGGFVAVPVSVAGKILGRDIYIHQQDVRLSLTNKLLRGLAKKITVAFAKSLNDFPQGKAVLVGNPVRQAMLQGDRNQAYQDFGLDPVVPTVLIIGGGTGAESLNDITLKSLDILLQFCQVIHLTGGKIDKINNINNSRYKSFVFLQDELKQAYAVADLVVTRAGLGTLTEIVALSKPAIIIPMPNSQQEDNANEFLKNNAAAVLSQANLTPENFSLAIKQLIYDTDERQTFSRNMVKVIDTTAAKKIVDLIYGK